MKEKRSKSEGGLTLVELMVTLGIIAFVSVAAMGTLLDVRSWEAHTRLKAAAGELYLHMQQARAAAVKSNRKWAIVFDTASPNRYHICSHSGADGNWATLADNTIVQTVSFDTYQHGTGFGAGAATQTAVSSPGPFDVGFDFVSFPNNLVIFSPTGLPASSGYCYLSNDEHEAYAVGAMTSGVVRVKKWTRDGWK